MYKSILEYFVNKKEVFDKTSLYEIDYEDPNNFVSLDEMYLSAKVTMSVDSMDNTNEIYI